MASAAFRMTSAHDFVASEAWSRKMNLLQRSWVSSARNAGKVAFSDFEVQPSAELCVSIATNAGKIVFSDFEVQPFADIVRVHRAKCW